MQVCRCAGVLVVFFVETKKKETRAMPAPHSAKPACRWSHSTSKVVGDLPSPPWLWKKSSNDDATAFAAAHPNAASTPAGVMADFGQTDFGQLFDRLRPTVGLTDFGQTDFGQFQCFSVLAKFCETPPKRPKDLFLDLNPKPYRPKP